jgi:hypothetical protein
VAPTEHEAEPHEAESGVEQVECGRLLAVDKRYSLGALRNKVGCACRTDHSSAYNTKLSEREIWAR